MRERTSRLLSYVAKDWYARFVSVFVAIIIMSCLAVFDGYWWSESFTIGYWSLSVALLIDVLLPIRLRLLRWGLRIVAAIVITFSFARIESPSIYPVNKERWLWWVEQTLPQLQPFIWISLSLLLIHVLLSIWAVTRTKMFGVMGASILLLTVADSFTPIWLWDNVAIVVFVGLVWLLLSHLERLKRTHPDSWGELLEYPIRVATPAIIVLSLLMIISLNAPAMAPLLQDPYTIWKNAKGEEVQVFLGEKAILDDTPLSKSNASSGYSRNDATLGGGFDFDFSPMMTVSTSHKSYWRGETKATYNGEGWVERPAEEGYQSVEKGVELQNRINRDLAETVEVEQIVTMVRTEPYPILFAAAPITKVNWIEEDNELFPSGLSWSPEYWELKWNMEIKYPTIYSVTSAVTVLDEEGLRGTEAEFSDPNANSFYSHISGSVPDRVWELAAEVTAEGTNDYDKARLLENYLSTSYKYNNKPDLTKLSGTSPDFVDQFLFELKEGYCDYFSTAMAVMARTLGMPTRWVKGFSPGVLPSDSVGPPEEFMTGGVVSNPLGAGTYTVRNSDAHSWVEIYFEGYGWIPFEPTAGFDFPYRMPAGEEVSLPDKDMNEEVAATNITEKSYTSSKVILWTAVSALFIGVVALVIIRRRDFSGLWIRLRTGSYSTNDQIVVETGRLIAACNKRGFERKEYETIREAIIRWTNTHNHKRFREDFRTVLNTFEKAKYGAGSATKEEVDHFVTKVRYLIGELK
ncbi:transglutaminase domain-containing protein [Paenibacillus sp. GSMTC-2017]|uniref:transglutaminase TgpA family protein n=1 Tax=Paenibacillus sp. GSMTC-2017 TaxID=2794350 RepID=UPI0018D93F5F|nr:transglutaminase domain-containing protein [Paenibacillus sp. GSMTC-2017]MBH5317026.1 transglutaminase domain-containing protein [Paenibacillus sp. GSMTC-2017]